MSKIDELRAELVMRAEQHQKTMLRLRDEADGYEREWRLAIACLNAHDAAVIAMAAPLPAIAPDTSTRRERRNLMAEVEKRLGDAPLSVNDLVSMIGDVREKQVTAALEKLHERGRAVLESSGWRRRSPVVSKEPTDGE